jgi:uncharacterized protein YbjT (DUF2867 family)
MKVIITGTTGMVGEGVLLECLAADQITKVLSVSRKSNGIVHPKLKEYIAADFLALKENDDALAGYDACFFCAGVTSIGMKEPEYKKVTYDTALAFAHALSPKPAMTFAYISGAGTDSSEKGRLIWARVKGRTENDLMKLPFKQVFAFRPGGLQYTKGQKHISSLFKVLSRLYPAFNLLFPNGASTLKQLGQAMLYAAQYGYEKKIVEVRDIKILSERWSKQEKQPG